jgi:hypothetical protein
MKGNRRTTFTYLINTEKNKNQMAINPNPDRNQLLMARDHGTICLITDLKADYYLLKSKEKNPLPPPNRFSRPCGGKGGFDDYVERWHE